KRPIAASRAFCTSASLVTSAGANSALSPSAFATASPFEFGRSTMTALPPPSMTVRTVASPRPEAPPVTRAMPSDMRMGRVHSVPGPPALGLCRRLRDHPRDPQSGPMHLDLGGHPLHTRALGITLSARDDGRVDVHGTVLDLRKRGFVPVGGDL